MSTAAFDNFQGPNNTPANFPYGIRIGAGAYGDNVNNIGIPGQPGFGVGICPGPLPAGMGGISGYTDPLSNSYGNYRFSDGSEMVWIPAFYYKWGTEQTAWRSMRSTSSHLVSTPLSLMPQRLAMRYIEHSTMVEPFNRACLSTSTNAATMQALHRRSRTAIRYRVLLRTIRLLD